MARHYFKIASDFPHFCDKDPEAGLLGIELLKDLSHVVQLESVELRFELRSV